MALEDKVDKLQDDVKDLQKQLHHAGHCMKSACETFKAIIEHYNLHGEYMIADKCKSCMEHLELHGYDNPFWK